MKLFPKLFLISVCLCFIFSCKEELKNVEEVKPPFAGFTVPQLSFEINPAKDTVLEMKGGSSLRIPAGALVDKNGNAIKGNVKLNYIEYKDAASIAVSGIPMTVTDEAGKKQQMESAGMYQLQASANGEEAFIDQTKKIQVNFSSGVKGEYDLFYFETENKSEAQMSLAPPSDDKKTVTGAWTKLTKDNATADFKGSGKTFAMKFDTAKFPETKYLSDIKWQLAYNENWMDPAAPENSLALNRTWKIAKLSHPKYKPTVIKSFGEVEDTLVYRDLNFTTDSSIYYLCEKGDLNFYDSNGNLKLKLSDSYTASNLYNNSVSPNQDFFITYSLTGERFLRNKQGGIIMSLGKNQQMNIFANNRNIIYSEVFPEKIVVNYVSCKGEKLVSYTQKVLFDKKRNEYYNWYDAYTISKDHKNAAMILDGNIIVTNENGKIVASQKVSPKALFGFAEYNNTIIIYEANKTIAWDWLSDKSYTNDFSIYDQNHLSDDNGKTITSVCCGVKTEIILENNSNGKVILWNWLTGTTFKEFNTNQFSIPWFSKGGRYIHSYSSYESNLFHNNYLYSSTGKLILTDNCNESFIRVSEDNSFILACSNGIISTYDKNGNKISSLFKNDSTVRNFYFADSVTNNVVVTKSTGEISLYNVRGKLLRSTFYSDPDSYLYVEARPNASGLSIDGNVLINWEGELLYDLPRRVIKLEGSYTNTGSISVDKKTFVSPPWGKSIICKLDSVELPKNVYKLTLSNFIDGGRDYYSFETYVVMNNQDLAAFEKYEKIKQEKITDETKRKEKEESVIRTFKISKFGIYNYDRYYHDSTAIEILAEVEGLPSTGYTHYTFLLVTGINETAVIKYTQEQMKIFRFKAEESNTLLAVLPDDKLAIFSKEEFAKLDMEELKKQKKFRFKMKVLNKMESEDALRKILQQGSA